MNAPHEVTLSTPEAPATASIATEPVTPAPPVPAAPAAPAATPPRPRWQRLLGLRPRPGRRIPYTLTKWGIVLVILLVGGVGGAGFAEYSMQPDFCRSCHLMEPYYQAWHTSTHKNVPCTDCHFEPGFLKTLEGKWQASSQAAKYITKTYGSKPHAEIRDVSCMRAGCHEQRLLEGRVNWTIKNSRGVDVTIKFDHTPHLNQERRGKQLRCVSCHSQIVQGQHLVVTLDTCYLCHMKGFEHGRNEQTMGGCMSCHDAPKAEIRLATGVFKHSDYVERGVTCENCHSDVIKGDGQVNRQVCWTCHNQPSQIARFGDTSFVHEQHVTRHKVECSSCHIQIEHNLDAGASLATPVSAKRHAGTQDGVCAQCHTSTHAGPAELYRGTGAKGVPDMPSPMFRTQVDCIACHKTRGRPDAAASVVGQTYTVAQDACNYCHGTKYEGVLETWKTQVDAHLDRAEAAHNDARDVVARAKLKGLAGLKASRLLSDAEHNIRLVKLGHGVHNVNYATAVLNAAIEFSIQASQVTPADVAMEVGR